MDSSLPHAASRPTGPGTQHNDAGPGRERNTPDVEPLPTDAPYRPTESDFFSLLPGIGGFAVSPGQTFWFVTFLLAALAFWYLTRRERSLAAEAADPWSDPEAVEHSLILAVDQQAPMGLEPLIPGPKPLMGFCSLLDPQRLYFQAASPLTDAEVEAWTSKKVRGHVSVRAGEALRLLRFESMVLTGTPDPRFPLLELARPTRLERFQRQAMPRTQLEPWDVLAMGVWAWPDPADATTLPAHPASLPPPTFLRHPSGPQTVLPVDISASGIAFKLAKRRLPSAPAACLVFLSLRMSEEKALNLWLACKNRHISNERSSAVAGYQIVQWAQVSRADAPVSWRHLMGASPSVPPLLRWTSRHQAEKRLVHPLNPEPRS